MALDRTAPTLIEDTRTGISDIGIRCTNIKRTDISCTDNERGIETSTRCTGAIGTNDRTSIVGKIDEASTMDEKRVGKRPSLPNWEQRG